MKRSLSSMVRAISPFTKSNSKANLKENSETSEFRWNLQGVDVKAALKQFYKQYNPEKALIVGEIMEKYHGDEELLMQQLCERYQLTQDDMQQFLDKAPLPKGSYDNNNRDSEGSSASRARRGSGSFRKKQDDEGSVASESVASSYRTFTWNLSGVDVGEAVSLVYRKHNPQKAPNVAALRSRPVEEQLQVLRQLCRRHELTEAGMQKFLDQAATASAFTHDEEEEEDEDEDHRPRPQPGNRARAVSAASHTNRLPFASTIPRQQQQQQFSPSGASFNAAAYLSSPSDEEEPAHVESNPRPSIALGGRGLPPPPNAAVHRPSQANQPPPPRVSRPSAVNDTIAAAGSVSFDSSANYNGGGSSGSPSHTSASASAMSRPSLSAAPPPPAAPPVAASPSQHHHSRPVTAAPPAIEANHNSNPRHTGEAVTVAGGQQVFNGQAEAVLLQQAIVSAQRRLLELNEGSETLSGRIQEACHHLAQATAIPLTIAEDIKANRNEINRALAIAEEAQKQTEIARLRSESLEKALQTARDKEITLDKALDEEKRLHSEARRSLESQKGSVRALQSDREDLLQLLTIVGSAKVKAPAQRILSSYLGKVGKAASSEIRAIMINPALPMGDRIDRLLSWRRGFAAGSSSSSTNANRNANSNTNSSSSSAGGGLFDDLMADVNNHNNNNNNSRSSSVDKCKRAIDDDDDEEQDDDNEEEDEEAAMPSLLTKAERQLGKAATATSSKKTSFALDKDKMKEKEMEAGYLAIKRADSNQRAAANSQEQRLAASLSQQEQRTQQALAASLTRAASPFAIAAPSTTTTTTTNEKAKEGETITTSKEDMANDWVECFDPKSRRKYYYSPSLKSSTWKKPKNMAGQPSASTSSAATNDNTSNSNSNSNVGSRSSTPDSTRTVNLDQLIMLGLLQQQGRSPTADTVTAAGDGSENSHDSNKEAKGFMNHTAASSSRSSSPAVSVRSNQGTKQQQLSFTNASSAAGGIASGSGSGGSDWVAAVDPKSQRKYWYNKVTKVSTWRRPVDVI